MESSRQDTKLLETYRELSELIELNVDRCDTLALQADQYKIDCARECLSMEEAISNYRNSTNALLDLYRSATMDEEIKEDIDNIKSKLNKACTIQMDFYDREYRKCVYSAPHESIPEEEDKEGEKDASVLFDDVHEILKARIQEYQKIISQQEQKEQQQ